MLRFTGYAFEKLPHPLQSLLNTLPVVSGLEIEKLLDFFGIVLKMHCLGQLLDAQLFEVLYPFCHEPLVEHLLSARAQNMDFEHFHRLILDQFIPKHRYHLLCQ
jgi:hypothetical protein